MNTNSVGQLYIVATPIGNLGDMVPRALETLQRVDLIACEDTRHSRKLLQHFSIDKPMLAYHDHDEQRQTQTLLAKIESGLSVALISDAGTPLISDPGFRLVREAHRRGIKVSPLPGACAAIAALSASGLASDQFQFLGFPPAKSTARRKWLQPHEHSPATLVFYEAPHRIVETLDIMVEVFGEDRPCAMARELTKTFETMLTGSLSEVAQVVSADCNQQRGEIVVLVEGAKQAPAVNEQEQLRILQVLLEELPGKKAAALTAKITGGDRKRLYNQAVSLKEGN